jgi:hypothetical protein
MASVVIRHCARGRGECAARTLSLSVDTKTSRSGATGLRSMGSFCSYSARLKGRIGDRGVLPIGALVNITSGVVHEVAFPNDHAVVAQNVVGGDDVKIEVRDRPVP